MGSSQDRNPVEELAEEFLDRKRRGESPLVTEYTEKYPEWAAEIEDLFPALELMEELKPQSDDLSDGQEEESADSIPLVRQIGDYRVLRQIGRGGMGVVYEAEQQSLGRRVALKVLPRSAAGDEKAFTRFQREARAAARMHHTNIVPVFEVGQDQEHVFYAMQLIQGQGLDDVIGDLKQLRNSSRAEGQASVRPIKDSRHELAASLVSGKFQHENLLENDSDKPNQLDNPYAETVLTSPGSTASAVLPGQSELSSAETNREAYYRSVAEIGLQTARALSYAHARGIIHRDIKPSNLLLDTTGVVWVTDFGLAKTGDVGLTHTGDILGTIRYMSPERFKGQCDVRADVYSLGLTLYELLALQPAFESPDRLKLIDMVAKTEVAPPRALDPRVPRDLETIVLKACDKDPKRRYQSADDMAEDLQRFIDDEPIKARRVSSFEQLTRWGRRNKGLASALSVVGVLLLVLAIGSTVAARAKNELANKYEDEAIKARDAQRVAEGAQKEADVLKDQAVFLTAQQLIGRAEIARANGDVSLAVLLEVEALKRDHSDPVRTDNKRRLIKADLRQCPRPVEILFHNEAIQDVRISYNGKWIATAAGDTIYIWDLASGKEIKSRQFDGEVSTLVFTNDDERVLCSVRTTKTDNFLWDWRNGKLIDFGVDHQAGDGNVFPYGLPYERISVPTSNGEWTPFSLKNGEQIGPTLKLRVKMIYWEDLPANDTTWLFYEAEEVLEEATRPEPESPRANGFAGQATPKIRFLGIWNMATGENHMLDGSAFQTTSNYRTPKLHGCLTTDGTLLATAHESGSELVLYRTSTGERVEGFHPTNPFSWIPWQFTPDNSTLLCSSAATPGRSESQFLNVLDPESGALQRSPIRCAPNSSELWSVSPTGHHVLVLNAEGNPQAVNLRNEEDYYPPMPQTASVTQMCWSPDGRLIAVTTSDGAMRVWDAATGQPRNALCRHPGNIVRLEFTLDGSRVITAGEQEVRIWPVDPPEPQSILMAREVVAAEGQNPLRNLTIYDSNPDKVQLNEAGTRLFVRTSVSEDAQPGQQPEAAPHARVEVWNTVTRKMEKARVVDVQRKVETRSSFGMQVETTGERLLIYNYPFLFNSSFDPIHRVYLRAGTRGDNNSVAPACQVWNIKTDRVVSLQIPADARALDAQFTADPGVIRVQYLKSATPGEPDEPIQWTQQLFDNQTGQPVGPGMTFDMPDGSHIVVTSDGELLASIATQDLNVVIVRNLRSGAEVFRFPLPDFETVLSLEFKRNDRVLVIKSRKQSEGILRLIDPFDGKLIFESFGIDYNSLVRSRSIDDEAIRVVLKHSAQDRRIEVYEVASNRSIFLPHEQSVTAFSISSDGRFLLTATADRNVRCWELTTGELLDSVKASSAQLDNKPTRLERIQFSSDNQRIIIAYQQLQEGRRLDAGLVQIWDVETGQPVASFWTQALESSLDTQSPDHFITKTDNGYDLIDLSGETGSLEEIESLAQALSGRQLNARGLVQPVRAEEFRGRWEKTARHIWENLASPRTGHAWFQHEFAKMDLDDYDTYTSEIQNASSLWYVNQLITSDDRPSYHVARLVLNYRLGNTQFVLENEHDVIARLEADRSLPQEQREILIRRALDSVALIHAKRGQWRDASLKYEEAYRKTVGVDPEQIGVGQLVPLKYAAICALRAGDRVRYEDLCEEYLRLPQATLSPRERITGIMESFLLLIPRPRDFCEQVKKRSGGGVPFRYAPPELVAFRSGDDSTALNILNRSPYRSVSTMMIEAMAHFHLGDIEEARDIYERGMLKKNQPVRSPLMDSVREFHSRAFMPLVEAEILQMEADRVLNGKDSAR